VVTAGQRRFASYAIDVLVYVTVLNLFVEYSDDIIIDSFTISIFTAFVLKLLLDVILAAEHRVSDYFKQRQRPFSNVLRVMSVWFILFSSKFVILEVVDLIFGDHVELGGFLHVIGLVIAMMVAREVFDRIYKSLGTGEPTVPSPPPTPPA
jgi:hypothetical protein